MGRQNDESATQRFVRVPASTRLIDETRAVCVADFDSEVQLLDGAARVVWEQLETPRTIAELAARIGIDKSDEYLRLATAMLTDTRLIRVVR